MRSSGSYNGLSSTCFVESEIRKRNAFLEKRNVSKGGDAKNEQNLDIRLVDVCEKVADAVFALSVVQQHEARVARRHKRRHGEVVVGIDALQVPAFD